METRKNLERALNETEGPMRITSECIYHREGRKGIDLVNDGPENSLMKEVDTIKASQDRMRRTLEQVSLFILFVRYDLLCGVTKLRRCLCVPCAGQPSVGSE